MRHDGGARRQEGDVRSSSTAEVDLDATADEEVQDRIVEAAGRAAEEAIQGMRENIRKPDSTCQFPGGGTPFDHRTTERI